jgi:hypothetical protein
LQLQAAMAGGSEEESCFLRDAGITEIGCAAVRAAARPAATLLDLKNNRLLRGFGGLSQLFPNLQSLVLSNNVLGDCSPSGAASWAAALVSAAPPSLRRLDVAGNGLSRVPWDDLAALRLFDLILDDNALATLGRPSSSLGATAKEEATPLRRSLRSLSVKGNKLAGLEGVAAIACNLDALDARDNLIAFVAQLAPLAQLGNTLQSVRLDGNPCMTGEFCADACWRATLLLKWAGKVVLLNGIQIPDKPRLRKAFCNNTGGTNISNGKACPCGLRVLDYEPLELVADVTTEGEGGGEEETQPDAKEKETAVKNVVAADEHITSGGDPDQVDDASETPEEKKPEPPEVNSVAQVDPKPLAASPTPDEQVEKKAATIMAVPEQPTCLPEMQDMPPILKRDKISTAMPRRPDTNISAAPSPRKQKMMVKSSIMAIMPFAEKKRGDLSFVPLGLGGSDRGGVRGIGTGGAMPFRKLGQRRVPRPVQRGYGPMEGSTWLSEMLKKAKKKKGKGGGRR